MAALGRIWPLLLVELAFWLGCNRKSVAFTLRDMAGVHATPLVLCGFVASSPQQPCAPTEGLTELFVNQAMYGNVRSSTSLPLGATNGLTADGRRLTPPASYCTSCPGSRRQPRALDLAAADGKGTAAGRWGIWGDCAADSAAVLTGHMRRFHEGRQATFSTVSTPLSYGGCHGGYTRRSDRRTLFQSSTLFPGTYACQTNEKGNGKCGPVAGEPLHYPQDMEAFQQAFSRLDERFLQIAKET